MRFLPRRSFLSSTGLLMGMAASLSSGDEARVARSPLLPPVKEPKLSLNTSTVRGHQLTVPRQMDVAAVAGFDGIEPWIGDLRAYVDKGGQLAELRSRREDLGLAMSGAIGFAKWIVEDPDERRAGLEEARRDMTMVAELGGVVMAAPPIGLQKVDLLPPSGPPSLEVIADRYRELLLIGEQMGVTPLLELWGFSPVLHRLSELAYVATAAARPNAAVLPDFYHIYKGGNEMTSLAMIEASRMPLFHINDYPAQPERGAIADKDRVYPGDGVCPLVETIGSLLRNGFTGTFSLELFNPDYWKQPVEQVASEGALKSREVVRRATELVNSGSMISDDTTS